MQSNPRILVNLLVILVTILVNLLVKLTRMKVRGAMGGLSPLHDASRECILPPQTRGDDLCNYNGGVCRGTNRTWFNPLGPGAPMAPPLFGFVLVSFAGEFADV